MTTHCDATHVAGLQITRGDGFPAAQPALNCALSTRASSTCACLAEKSSLPPRGHFVEAMLCGRPLDEDLTNEDLDFAVNLLLNGLLPS